MKLINLILSAALAAGVAANSFGSVFFSIDLGTLQDENGEALVGAGMLYLVASTDDDTFSLPSDGSIIDGASDDEIVAFWDLSAESSQGGEYIVASGAVPFGDTWEAGNDLAILWFPNLTVANQGPAAGEPYGFYRNTSDSGAGDVWEMPENGTLLHSLKFFPDISNPLVEAGDVPSFVASAGFGAGETAGSPTPPTNIATNENAPGTVSFNWAGAAAPGGGYRIERKLAGGSDWTVLGTVGSEATSFDDPSVGRGKDYDYRLVAINGFDSVASSSAKIQSLRSSLANIATRGRIGSGAEALILGFVIEGTGPIDILATAKGPDLANVGISNFALDPTVSLFPFGVTAPDVQNDDWGADAAAIGDFVDRSFAQAIADSNSKDAALAFSPDGTQLFTAIVNDNENANGVGLVEVFDASGTSRNGVAPNDSQNRLVNVATRGFVGTGADVLIAGFIVDGVVDSKLLLRGLGPSIAGLSGTLENPTITLFRTDFTQPGFPQIEVATNDDWEDDPTKVDEIIAVSNDVGAAVLNTGSKDSILLVDAMPGLYSFVLSGVSEGTGIGLVEVFLAD